MGRSGPALRQSRPGTPSSAGQSQAANIINYRADWLKCPLTGLFLLIAIKLSRNPLFPQF